MNSVLSGEMKAGIGEPSEGMSDREAGRSEWTPLHGLSWRMSRWLVCLCEIKTAHAFVRVFFTDVFCVGVCPSFAAHGCVCAHYCVACVSMQASVIGRFLW